MTAWSPLTFVVDGVFAAREDLVRATKELAEMNTGRAVVASISTRYLIESASYAYSSEDGWAAAMINRLRKTLETTLRDADDPIDYVCKLVRAELQEASGKEPFVSVYGGHLERAGKIATVVACTPTSASRELESAAAHAAVCALGSRAAASSRDNAISLATINPTRRIEPESQSPRRLAAETRRQHLVRFARQTLDAYAVAVYEVDALHPRQATAVTRNHVSAPEPLPAWIPYSVEIPDYVEPPQPLELGGSRFESLGELVGHCMFSRRRLVGTISGRYWVYGVPYGIDEAPERPPAGVLALAWDHESALGLHEMATSRMVAVQLARQYEKRRTTDSVTLVTNQLADISGLRASGSADDLTACAEGLRLRTDVAMIAPSVIGIMSGLVQFSGAKSATCRLVAGGEGDPLTRHLLRLHCEGDISADQSPPSLSIDSVSESANAWVAVHGEHVHLRELELDEATGLHVSPDLAGYPGLRGVVVYRPDVKAELCVPILAEQRLVGTVNLEAESPWEFDDTWVVVAEYAQLIGIALLEARRRIGVSSVTEAGGFLDHRHLLDAKVDELAKAIEEEQRLSSAVRNDYAAKVAELENIVTMRRLGPAEDLSTGATVRQAIAAAMGATDWADADLDPADLIIGDRRVAEAALNESLAAEAAQALTFGVGQALHNARRHGLHAPGETGWHYLAVFRAAKRMIGGVDNVYVSVVSACDLEAAERITPQRVFREPIPADDGARVSLGTYLAGEELRRCGGSACLRVAIEPDAAVATIEAELSVPVGLAGSPTEHDDRAASDASVEGNGITSPSTSAADQLATPPAGSGRL